MPHTLFISDLHLTAQRRDIAQGLISLCQSPLARSADALYILGDFVEFWIGDDTPTEGIDDAIDALGELGTHTPLFFQHGNRDFLIGRDFARRCRFELLDETVVIDLYGQDTLLLHGDTLCTDDVDYQQFRHMVRNADWQADFLNKTLPERLEVVKQIRAKTQEAMTMKASDIMDVNQNAVVETLEAFGVQHMIHGHTHRPAQHTLTASGQPATRTVLSDWDQHGNCLLVTPERQTLIDFDWQGSELAPY
ncbi:UDP-2,3-diacylglucosamine hydrolase [gamma proteobacterium HTCC5015]|nr:UDP-2,3-diacylglucosamine hydrolase [gamma proteobacterium HTCC5015]